jgi:PPOX class probable F420-dependent enzyme
MELRAALAFIRSRQQGVLVTLKANGRPQLSNIVYGVGDDDVIRISVTDTRAKVRNLRRDPRTSLYVTREDFWGYAVLEGDAELTPVAADPHDSAVDELVELYRMVQGEHPDWDDFRRSMVRDRRLVVRLRPQHAYGMAGT